MRSAPPSVPLGIPRARPIRSLLGTHGAFCATARLLCLVCRGGGLMDWGTSSRWYRCLGNARMRRGRPVNEVAGELAHRGSPMGAAASPSGDALGFPRPAHFANGGAHINIPSSPLPPCYVTTADASLDANTRSFPLFCLAIHLRSCAWRTAAHPPNPPPSLPSWEIALAAIFRVAQDALYAAKH